MLFTSALQDIFSLTFDKVNHFHVVLIVQVRSMVGMAQCIVYGHVEAIGGGQKSSTVSMLPKNVAI